jgi:FkbM family methyltransferase
LKKLLKVFLKKIVFNLNLIFLKKNLRGSIGNLNTNSLIEKSLCKTTFSQQGEDLILERIIQNILGWDLNERRFYVDIGAYHPIMNSVTYTLYKRKWRGIVFDPYKQSKTLFEKYRPEDIFINNVVGETDNIEVDFYFSKKRDFSMQSTKYPKKEKNYEIQKLKQVNITNELERNSVTNFDIINIDVEGAEYEILKTIDFNKYRPSVVIVEIKSENINEALSSDTIKLLFNEGYTLHAVAVLSYFFVRKVK